MSSHYLLIFLCGFIFLGCNSSSNKNSLPSGENSEVVLPAEVIQEEVIQEEAIPEEIAQEELSLEEVACTGLAKLNVNNVNATDEVVGYEPNKVIDGNFTAESRWSTTKSDQSLTLELSALSLIKGLSLTWFNRDQRSYSYDIEVSKDKKTWISVASSALTNHLSTRSEYTDIIENTARYVKIMPKGNNVDASNHIVEIEVFGCMEDIATTIELNDWYLSIPVDEANNTKAKSIYESILNNDYFNAEFFFLNTEGGLVFRSPIEGAKTSTNTKYTRTELREMLRQGNTNINVQGVNKNNWVFSIAPSNDKENAGGIDGELFAELMVNHVTKTGDGSQVGRVIIGQIHANDDEPIRVYYRKLPYNEKGSIYLAHEIQGGDDIYHELIGTRSKSADNPENGIKLNERFAYNISVQANKLTLTIIREGQADISKTVDMTNSGYDLGGQYMYFKAGVYNQNNTGDNKDYVQATFYRIENSHAN